MRSGVLTPGAALGRTQMGRIFEARGTACGGHGLASAGRCSGASLGL